MPITPEGALLWQPSAARIENAQLTAYMAWLEKTRGQKFTDYHALWQWSVDEVEAFCAIEVTLDATEATLNGLFTNWCIASTACQSCPFLL